jgi:hypothetical protein
MGLSFCCSGPLLFFYIAIVTAVASLPVATELSVPVVLLAVTELSVVGGSAVSSDVGCGGVVCGIGCIASTMLCLPHHYLYSCKLTLA